MLVQLETARFRASGTMRPRVLVVDDEALICDMLCLVLEDDYEVICADTSNEALLVLAGQKIDVMLLDCGGGGADRVAKRADRFGIPMAWMTDDHTAIDANYDAVVSKPFHIDRVLQVLSELLAMRRDEPAHVLVQLASCVDVARVLLLDDSDT